MHKINVLPIFLDHFRTMMAAPPSNRLLKRDLILFFAVPAVMAYVYYASNVFIGGDARDGILVASSIYIPLLINVVFLLYNIINRGKLGNRPMGSELLSQIYHNIAYLILVSFISVIVLGTTCFLEIGHTQKVVQSIFVFISCNIVLTSLMVLKRIHKLMCDEMKQT